MRHQTMVRNTSSLPVKKWYQREMRDRTWRWVLLMPAVIIMVTLLGLPVLWTLYAAFTDLHLFRQPGIETRFVGFQNFEKLLSNTSFWRTVQNTIVFMLGVVPLQLFIGVVVSLALNNIIMGRKFFRTWFLMPLMVSPVVVSFVVGMKQPESMEPQAGKFFGALQPRYSCPLPLRHC